MGIGIFENVLGFNADLSTDLVAKTKILDWVLIRIQSKTHDENRGYAAELLSILLQNNRSNRLEFSKKNGVETSLQVLSVSSVVANLRTKLTTCAADLELSTERPVGRGRN